MAAIVRKTQKLFGGNYAAAPNGQLAKFGSLAAATPAYSGDPAVIQALAAFLNGWSAAVIQTPNGNNSPAFQDFNALFYLITYQLQYGLQRGIPEWDDDGSHTASATTYFKGCVALSTDGLGTPYVSLVDNNIAPLSNTNNWASLASLAKGLQYAKAWAEFDGIGTAGGNAILRDSFGVDHVVKEANGQYLVVFSDPSPFAGNNYVPQGFAGPEDGQVYGPGDNAVVCGGIPGMAGLNVRNSTACRIFTVSPATGLIVQPGVVSVSFLGR